MAVNLSSDTLSSHDRFVRVRNRLMPFWEKVDNFTSSRDSAGISRIHPAFRLRRWTPRRKTATIHDSRVMFWNFPVKNLDGNSSLNSHLCASTIFMKLIEEKTAWQFRRTPFQNVIGWEAVNTDTDQAFHFYDDKEYEINVVIHLLEKVMEELEK